MTNRTTAPRQCTVHTWCEVGTKYNEDEHNVFHASTIVDLQAPTPQADASISDGWWCWLSEHVDGPNAGVTMVHIEGHFAPATDAQHVELPAADLDAILASTETTVARQQLADLVGSATPRPVPERAPTQDFVCPKFAWCTYGREHPQEHDRDGVHAGDDIPLHGYGEDLDGTHDRGFMAYLAHDDGDEEPWLVVWGFGRNGRFVSEKVSGLGVLMLLAGVKSADELERLRAGVTAVDVVERQP